MQACCCQITRIFVSLHFITSNQDAEAISDEPEILSGARLESRYRRRRDRDVDGVRVGTVCPLPNQGEVWGGCHAHCPVKFLIFRYQKD